MDEKCQCKGCMELKTMCAPCLEKHAYLPGKASCQCHECLAIKGVCTICVRKHVYH
ncbi:hypothetical protein HYY69_03420 [Candidatus Woesearchaeota archaeon]|nr:hypothetical protein [Candidatus Woesearchaeota archaeon]